MGEGLVKISLLTGVLFTQAKIVACPVPSSAEDVVRCAESESPGFLRSKGQAAEIASEVQIASQLPNPEFEGEYIRQGSESETSLAVQIPIADFLMRGAKKRAAEATLLAARTVHSSTLSQVRIEAILKIHRLRQHGREKDLVDEALKTFQTLVKQYGARSQLAPEQEVALVVFRMAESDYRMQKSKLMEEEAQLGNYFLTVTSLGLEQVRRVLPKAIVSWPNIRSESGQASKNEAPDIQIARAEFDRAQAEQRVAKLSVWPELKIGPIFKRFSSSAGGSTAWGAALSLPLPLLNVNGGERSRAEHAKANALVNIALTTKEIAGKKEELMLIYESAVNSLQGGLSPSVLNRNHERIEKLFMRGIISSSLVIEAHRQLIDVEKSKNEKELVALEALWSSRALNGITLEGSM